MNKLNLYIYNMTDSTSKKIKSGVKTAVTWINDSLLVYAKISKPNKDNSLFFNFKNIFYYNLISSQSFLK